jgi:hypothetical protein
VPGQGPLEDPERSRQAGKVGTLDASGRPSRDQPSAGVVGTAPTADNGQCDEQGRCHASEHRDGSRPRTKSLARAGACTGSPPGIHKCRGLDRGLDRRGVLAPEVVRRWRRSGVISAVGGGAERDQLVARAQPVSGQPDDVVARRTFRCASFGLPTLRIHWVCRPFLVIGRPMTSPVGAIIRLNWFQFVSISKG